MDLMELQLYSPRNKYS